jgi:hypothetical protein
MQHRLHEKAVAGGQRRLLTHYSRGDVSPRLIKPYRSIVKEGFAGPSEAAAIGAAVRWLTDLLKGGVVCTVTPVMIPANLMARDRTGAVTANAAPVCYLESRLAAARAWPATCSPESKHAPNRFGSSAFFCLHRPAFMLKPFALRILLVEPG